MSYKYSNIKNIGVGILSVLLFCAQQATAQQSIKGVVTNKKGQPLMQAVIVSKGTEKAIKVDNKGRFSFVSDKTDTLIISTDGYLKQQLPVQLTDREIKVVLTEIGPFANTITLPFGSTIQNQYFTGSVSGISGNQMEKFHVPNASNSITGRIPGLITRAVSDEPGNDAANFYVRGRSSFNTDNPNLYVDNVPVAFSLLDPLEIDQLQVFKDGVANGVYGMDGANKSIFITTKRGEAFNNKINFYTSLVVQKPTALPKFLGAQQYMQLYNEARVNDGLPTQYTQAQIDAYNNGSNKINNPDADWYGDNLKDQSFMQKYNLTLSGGNNIVRYFILGGVTSQQGLFNNTDLNFSKYGYKTNNQFNRYNLRSNFDVNITKSLSAFVDLSARISETTNPGTSSGGAAAIFNNMAKYPPNLFPVVFDDGTIGGNAQYKDNPYGLITKKGFFKAVNRVTFGNVGFKQNLSKILSGLSATASYSFYNSFIDNEGFTEGSPTFAVYNYVNGVIQPTVGNDVLPTYAARPGTQNRIGTFWAKFNYDAKFGTDHKLTADLGYNQSKQTPAGDDFPYVSINLYAKAHYQYKDRYLADLSLSRSTTEVFPDNHRYGLFPSFGAGWILSNEDFLKSSKTFSFLKIRGSYAILGNGNVGGTGRSRYYYVDLYTSNGNTYNFGQTPAGTNAYGEGNLSNPNITWEKSNMANVGIDAAFLDNKLGVTLEVFNERRNQILVVPGNISSLIGQTTRPLNLGVVNNHGIDASIWYKNKINDFGYSVAANLSLNKNKIIYNAESAKPFSYLNTAGQPIGTVYGLTAIGLFKDAADVANSPKQTFQQVQAGDIKYLDRNGDNIIDNNDFAAVAKSSVPQANYGLSLGLSYKNFDLTADFQGAYGFSVDLRSNATYGFTNNSKPSALMLNRWTPSTVATAQYPRLSFAGDNNYQTSTFWLKDVNFIRLKNIELGYNLTASFLQKARIKNLRLYASGLNLATWSNIDVDFVDPEYAQAGISQYPRMKNLVFGLNVQF